VNGAGQYPGIYSGAYMAALDRVQGILVDYTPIVLYEVGRFWRDAWRSLCEDVRWVAETVTGYRLRRRRLARKIEMQQWHADWTVDRGALRAATEVEGYELSRRVVEP